MGQGSGRPLPADFLEEAALGWNRAGEALHSSRLPGTSSEVLAPAPPQGALHHQRLQALGANPAGHRDQDTRLRVHSDGGSHLMGHRDQDAHSVGLTPRTLHSPRARRDRRAEKMSFMPEVLRWLQRRLCYLRLLCSLLCRAC